MSDKTTNYNFDTPGLDGAANIEVQDANWEKADTAIAAKVDKVEGKGLSTNEKRRLQRLRIRLIKSAIKGCPRTTLLIHTNQSLTTLTQI